jgi:tRNA(Ile)-lysidine synthase
MMPLLLQRWPGAVETLSRAAGHQAAAAQLLEELASSDLEQCGMDGNRLLNVKPLLALSRDRMANILRYWIRLRGFPVPAERQLLEVLDNLLTARPDAEPCVSWHGAELRRYRDAVFITVPLPRPTEVQPINWDVSRACKLPLGELRASRNLGKGIKASKCVNGMFQIKFRHGSEVIRKSGHRRQLRKLFQEQGVPACYRDLVPLVYIGDRLVAVTGLCIDEDYSALPDEAAWDINWSESEDVYTISN